MKEITNKNLFFIAFIFLTVSVIIFLFNLLGNMLIFDYDDLNSTYDSYPLWREENGRYVFNFLSRVFCLYIPKLLGFHIQDAINTFCVFIYGIILSFLFATCAKFYLIKSKSIIIYILFYLFTGVVFFSYALRNGPFYSAMVTFQYGYVLASACNILFLSFIMSYISSDGEKYKDADTKNIKYILFVILAFCAGNSTQIATYTIIISLILISIITYIKNKFNFKLTKELIWNKITKKPIIAYICGLLLMVLCPGFWIEVSWRHADSFSGIIKILPDFLNCYNDFVFQEYKSYYTVIIMLAGIVLIKNIFLRKNILKTLGQIIISVIPIAGVWAYFLTLILAGNSFPSVPESFWVKEPFYHFYFQMILCSVIALIAGLCFEGISNKIIKSIMLFPLLFMFLFLSNTVYAEDSKLTLNKNLYGEYPDMYNSYISGLKEKRQLFYKRDKMILTALYKQKEPISFYTEPYSVDLTRYFPKAYNVDLTNKNIQLADYKDATEYFESIGGIITEDELEKTKFGKLFNKDFVLNQSGKNSEADSNNTDL